MEPTNKPPIEEIDTEVLPDADEIERNPLPFLARIAWYVVFVMLVIFLIWITFSEVDRIVVASGKLVTTSSNIIVQPLEMSIIQKLNVRQGQLVKKGDRLAILDSTFAQADKDLVRTRLISLNTQVERLEAELAGRDVVHSGKLSTDSILQKQLSEERIASFKAQTRKFTARIARLRAGIKTNRQDQKIMASRVKVLQEMEVMNEKLVAQKSVAKVSLLEAQERRLQVERDVQKAKNQEKELKNELMAVLAEKEAFGKNWRQRTMEKLLTVSRERDSMNEQFQKAEMRRDLVILTSPVDAVVLEVAKLSQGSVVRAAETLFTLVPLDSKLEAEVQINSVDIGYVKRGIIVKLKFSAFPSQRHGSMNGKIRTISEDAFQREGAMGKSEAYYLSRIRLGKMRLKKLPKGARLLPGMSLTAQVVVKKRSVISYFLWPLAKTLDESIQEP